MSDACDLLRRDSARTDQLRNRLPLRQNRHGPAGDVFYRDPLGVDAEVAVDGREEVADADAALGSTSANCGPM